MDLTDKIIIKSKQQVKVGTTDYEQLYEELVHQVGIADNEILRDFKESYLDTVSKN